MVTSLDQVVIFSFFFGGVVLTFVLPTGIQGSGKFMVCMAGRLQ